jgi:(2Fe-2S) ferredoxin
VSSQVGYERHVFACMNQRPADHPRGCCGRRGGEELRFAFKREIKARGLKGKVRANAAGCLDHCEHGAVVVVYPDGVWYGGVTEADVAEIVEEHLVHGRPVERLRIREKLPVAGREGGGDAPSGAPPGSDAP